MTQNRAEQLWWASGCKHCRRWCERYDTPSARLRVTVRAKLVRFHTFIRLRESPRQWHSSCAHDDSCHRADLARSKRLVYTLARSGLGYGINAFESLPLEKLTGAARCRTQGRLIWLAHWNSWHMGQLFPVAHDWGRHWLVAVQT
jgi:hypothetical protein